MNTQKELNSISQSLNFLSLVAAVYVPFFIGSKMVDWGYISCTPSPAPVVEPWEGDLPPQGEIGALEASDDNDQ